MPTVQEPSRLAGDNPRRNAKPPGLLSKLLTVALGVLVLVGALVFSILAFVAIAATALVVGVFLWWNTRELRRRMREQPPGGRVIDGEVIRDVQPPPSDRP